jgi:hypothetical protein
MSIPTSLRHHTYSAKANELERARQFCFSLWQCPSFPNSFSACFCSLKHPLSRDQLESGIRTREGTGEGCLWEALESLCLGTHPYLSHDLPLPTLASGSQRGADTEQVALTGAWIGGRLGGKRPVSIWARRTHGPEFLGTGGEQAGADELLSNRVSIFSQRTLQR